MEELLKLLNLSLPAQQYLCGLWQFIQFMDDVIDGDTVTREQAKSVLTDVLVKIPLNPFYLQHAQVLIPVVSNALLVWNASDLMEVSGKADERSYIYRSSFYNVLLQVYAIEYGIDKAMENSAQLLSLYGETYENYKTEFNIN